MGLLRRRRFDDLIARQLNLFAEAHIDLLQEIDEHRTRWRTATRDGAEEAFGDEQDRIDWAAEELAELFFQYAATLDDATEADYQSEFSRSIRRRFNPLADAFDLLTDSE